MATKLFDWGQFHELIVDQAQKAVLGVLKQCSEASVYSVVFHEFYAEEHDRMDLPLLALNTTDALQESEDDKWSSPDWRLPDIVFARGRLKRLQLRLNEEASSGSVDQWYVWNGRFMRTFCSAARSLHRELKKHPKTTKDFACFVFDGGAQIEIEILRRSTTPAVFKKHFPYLLEQIERQRNLENCGFDQKLSTFQKDLFEYSDQVLELGESATPMLLSELNNEEQGWVAADLLGRLGIADTNIITALRKKANTGAELEWHSTSALALLGDTDFLLDLADDSKTRNIAIEGITSLYSSAVNHCLRPPALDYGPLKTLLTKNSCRRKVGKLYSGRDISDQEINTALAALRSKYRVIRENALCVLGDRRLGKKAGERILPAIADRLQDRCANVRRLAIINLTFWKKDARAFGRSVRRLLKDPDQEVRSTARQYLKSLGG